MKRICIYPKDIQVITGKGERYARLVYNKIRRQKGKSQDQLISIDEYCEYSGLAKEEVEKMIF